MISPLPGATTTQAGLGHLPAARASAPRWSTSRASGSSEGGGYLTLTRPWPSMLRGIYGDPERYRETYWSRFADRYFAGDGAKVDDDGYLWLLGRVDDVMNVSGHRVSTTEVESALVDHPTVAEAAVVGAKDDTTGQAIIAFVTLQGRRRAPSDELGEELREHVATQDRRHRPAQDDHLHRRPAQDPQRQDHAPAAARTWPRAATSATPPRWPTPAVVEEIRSRAAAAPPQEE